MLRNLVKILSIDSVLAFYHASLESLLRYGIILWGRSPDSQDVFVKQKKMIRILFRKPYDYNCKDLFCTNNLMTVPSLYIYETIKLAISYNFINQEDLTPKHSYNSRHYNITNLRIRLTKSESNVNFSAIQLLNALPLSLKLSFKNDYPNVFLKLLKKFCLEKVFYHINEFLGDS